MFNVCDTQIQSAVTNRIIQRYQPENVYAIHVYPESRNGLNAPLKEQFIHHELLAGHYEQYVWAEDCPPLDSALLGRMAAHQVQTLKMMERHDHQPTDFESRIRLYHKHLRYWNYFLDRSEIDGFVCYMTPHEVYDYLIYLLCREKGIATVFPYYGPILEYMYFFQDIHRPCPEVAEVYQRLSEEYQEMSLENIPLGQNFQEAFNFYSDPNQDKTPVYMKSKPIPVSKRLAVLARKPFGFAGRVLKSGVSHLSSSAKVHSRVWRQKKQTRELYREYDRLSSAADFNAPYVYLPLHYQPENTTNPWGGVFVHQLLVAQMISFYLPKGAKLYVKEHPNQEGRCRETQLYHDLLALPNVILVDRSTDTYQLLKHCAAVAAVTGTAGFEGLFMEKPFLMFGSFINMYAPGVFNIRNNEDCQAAVQQIFSQGPKHTLKDMKIYLKALEQVQTYATIMPEVVRIDLDDDENISRIAAGMNRVLDEQWNSGKRE